MSDDAAFLFVTCFYFCVAAACGFLIYAALVAWKACDFRNEGYAWDDAVIRALDYFK